MKVPQTPPPMKDLWEEFGLGHFVELLDLEIGPEPQGKYLHWTQLRHKPAPHELNHKAWWLMVKHARSANRQKLPFVDPDGHAFAFTMTESLLRRLHQLDRDASGSIQADAPITTDAHRDRYIINSLFEEAITSSQLEGASTTTRVAKDMLRSGRRPRDRSEMMILNNYHAMSFIRENRNERLSAEFILELHRILTQDTLDDPTGSGRWRRHDEHVTVQDNQDGIVLYTPPHAELIPNRLERLIDFANEAHHVPFIHPVACAVILHFMLSYEHPFIDGNGRTARALFYWYMTKTRYWLVEYISISKIIKRAPIKYAKSFLYVESDENDLTYFLDYQFDVILEAIAALFDYLNAKTEELRNTESIVRGELQQLLNHRQMAVISHALKHPGFNYTIKSHARSHAVTYQTSRTDLLKLSDLGLLDKFKRSKAFVFQSPKDLVPRIERTQLPEN